MYRIRHTISVILLGLFAMVQFLPALVDYSIQVHQSVVQNNIGRKKEVVTLRFSAEQWANAKRPKVNEIEVDGKLFDIRSVTITNNLVVVKGCYDTKEDKMLAISKDLKKKGHDFKKNDTSFKALFFEEPVIYSFFMLSVTPTMYVHSADRMHTSFLQEDSPPPKV